MPTINLSVQLSDKLGMQSVSIDYNDTGWPDNSETIEVIAFTIFKALNMNKESVQVQDLLHELGIERTLKT